MIARSHLRLLAQHTFLGLCLFAAPAQAQNGAWMGVVQAGGSLLTAVGTAASVPQLVQVGQALERFGATAASAIQGAGALPGAYPGAFPPPGTYPSSSGFAGSGIAAGPGAASTTDPFAAAGTAVDLAAACADPSSGVFGTPSNSEVVAAAIGDAEADPSDEGLDLGDGPGR